ncbi:MAG TPA: dihydroorotate dehydrogenase electron transfer subunit [Polyangia bacterium]|nr:dihydroorotate dehydrogenase electron transfer subunit [Polyangia bacterium]
MRYFEAPIVENRSLGGGYFVLRLSGCESLAGSRPGQFVMVRGDWGRDPLLPRAFSLLSAGSGGQAEILAKTVGPGTALLEKSSPGALLSVLGPLGTSFPAPSPETTDLLVAGGVGLPPLFMQAEHAARQKLAAHSEVLYGGRGAPDLVLLEQMKAFGVPLHLATEDGSVGVHGRVTLPLERRIEELGASQPGRKVRIMSCGPNAMLWAVGRIARKHGIECHLSLEEQMACGIGVCLGCAIPARSRPFRYVCKDGPVFLASDVLDVGAEPEAPGPSLCPS